ncbi:MAG: phosphotransferase [Planctomycetota bacterium]
MSAAAEQVIRGLSIWRHQIELQPLSGGITNLNFRVTDGEATYAARTGADDPRLGIDRANELACTTLAAAANIAPALVHADAGVLVSAFIAGTPLTPELARDPGRVALVAAAVRTVHGLGAHLTGHLRSFCAFRVARTYLRVAEREGLALPLDARSDLLRAELVELEARVAPYLPTFCHNDLMPGNFLDTAERLWVIDWEYAGIGHPLFDLAGFASNCELDEELERALLTGYGDFDLDAVWPQFKLMKAMAALRESLWGVVQGAESSIDFDYAGYRDDNYRKYRAALEVL